MTVGSKSYSNVGHDSGYEIYSMYSKTWDGQNGRTLPDGNIKWNPYTMSTVKVDKTRLLGLSCYMNSTVPNITCGNLASDGYFGAPGWDDGDTNKLLNKLASRVRQHDFNLGIALGEGKQTVSLVITTITRLRKMLVQGLIKKSFGTVLRGGSKRRLSQEDVSDVYLELVFGHLPLINDVFEAAKAYEALTKERVQRYSAAMSVVSTYEGSPSPTVYKAPGVQTISRRIVYEAREDLSVPRSLGLMSPYQVAWEITPWSFLFDYFLPIGTYLENLAIIPKLQGRFCISTKAIWQAVACRPVVVVTDDGRKTDYYGDGNTAVTTVVGFGREISSGLSVPLPSFKSLPDALSPRHIFNIVALSHQQVSRRL